MADGEYTTPPNAVLLEERKFGTGADMSRGGFWGEKSEAYMSRLACNQVRRSIRHDGR